MKTNLCNKNVALSLAFIMRFKVTRKRSLISTSIHVEMAFLTSGNILFENALQSGNWHDVFVHLCPNGAFQKCRRHKGNVRMLHRVFSVSGWEGTVLWWTAKMIQKNK